VSDTTSLWAAIKGAHSGDTIQLTAGTYSELRLDSANIAGNVTITSADPTHPAVVAGLYITSSSGLTFSNLEVTVDPKTGFAVMLGSDKNMVFDHLNMHGAAVGDGSAIMVRNSTNVAVTNSDIHDLVTGINHLDSSQLNFSNNNLHNIQADGIRGGGSSNVTISGNHFTDFFPKTGDHPDAIQFWTTNTSTASHDLTITNNVFVRGAGQAIQGIFVGNENKIPFQNVTITGNAIIGGMYHGISLSYGDHVTVTNNLVEGYTDMTSWIMLNNTTNSTEHDNTSTSYTGTGNVGLLEGNDQKIAQGAIGDTTTLTNWLSSQGGVFTDPAVAPDLFTPTTPVAAATMGIDASSILTSIQNAMAMGPYGGGWLL
jgi:hypothetical protein